MFLRVEFPCILQRLSLDEHCRLPVAEPDKVAEVFDTEHFTEIGEPCRRPCDYRFQKRYFLLVLRFFVRYLPAMLPLYFRHLSAVVGLHGLYSGLQGFDGFPVRGDLPMQGGVLPLQRPDLITAEKRTDTLGDVGCCGGRLPFQLLGLYLFFLPFEFLLRRFFLTLQIHYLRFEAVGEFLRFIVILLRGLVPCLRAINAPLQPVFRHRHGVGVLVGFQP